MTTSIPRIIYPELFFGFVAPIGASLSGPIQAFRRFFEVQEYNVVEIKVTDFFNLLERIVKPDTELNRSTAHSRYETYIKYGNQLRAHFQDHAFLAVASIGSIIRRRVKIQKEGGQFSKTVYFLNKFKRKEEIELLRSVYVRLFYDIRRASGEPLPPVRRRPRPGWWESAMKRLNRRPSYSGWSRSSINEVSLNEKSRWRANQRFNTMARTTSPACATMPSLLGLLRRRDDDAPDEADEK